MQFRRLEKYPNYGVSCNGDVYSYRKHKVLTPKHNWDGYLRIQIWDHGHCEFVSIHRLVAEAYLPKDRDDQTVINHKNGNKSDNRVENLEWCTQQENIRHAWRTGLSHKHRTGLSKPVIVKRDDLIVYRCDSISEAGRLTKMGRQDVRMLLNTGINKNGYSFEEVVR